MKNETLNKLSAINANIRELAQATDRIRTEINKMKEISDCELTIISDFYQSFQLFTNTPEVKMFLMILNQHQNNKETTREKRYEGYYPGGTKTFS